MYSHYAHSLTLFFQDEEEDDADEVGETGVLSVSSSLGDEGEEEEDNKSDDQMQQLPDGVEQDGDDEDEVHVYQDDSIYQKTEADEEFEHLLSKLMSENIKKSNVGGGGAVRSTKASYNMPTASVAGYVAVADSKLDQPITGGDGISFRMLKRGAKGKLEGQVVWILWSLSIWLSDFSGF